MMAEEFRSKEKLQKARAQVQRAIDLNKRMLEGSDDDEVMPDDALSLPY